VEVFEMKLGDLLNPEQYVLEILEGIEVVEGNLPEDGNDVEEALVFAKRAVAKQIPKKPNTMNDFNGDEHSRCPSCNFDLGYTVLCKDVTVCCWKCGQKLDWGE
jgi:hypothetical protein